MIPVPIIMEEEENNEDENKDYDEKDKDDHHKKNSSSSSQPSKTLECTSSFRRSELEKALSYQMMQKYDEIQFLENIQKANITDLW